MIRMMIDGLYTKSTLPLDYCLVVERTRRATIILALDQIMPIKDRAELFIKRWDDSVALKMRHPMYSVHKPSRQ